MGGWLGVVSGGDIGNSVTPGPSSNEIMTEFWIKNLTWVLTFVMTLTIHDLDLDTGLYLEYDDNNVEEWGKM